MLNLLAISIIALSGTLLAQLYKLHILKRNIDNLQHDNNLLEKRLKTAESTVVILSEHQLIIERIIKSILDQDQKVPDDFGNYH